MIVAVLLACSAGILIGISRQINGRLSLSTSPLIASFWNHVVGFAFLTALGLALGDLLPEGVGKVPWYDYLGGPIGVVFVAAGSWVIARIGAVNTALMMIGGQMVSSVLLDLALSVPTALLPTGLGVALVLAGIALSQGKRRS
ncbi:transporter family-2 protein [Rhizobium sp. PP-F2F-G48]|uniref:DMT family transporter n=1 Tax=Rhizobium sp. PP-F2F-G48 TaxID=2135651 RepID=UPI00104A65A4|nr:DMT family transporter [Rhizobium sp. PP-F2F-G48]TCM57265.1 transporter family-2 protein [Rhizobium sp. PP-F2F-G48]